MGLKIMDKLHANRFDVGNQPATPVIIYISKGVADTYKIHGTNTEAVADNTGLAQV